MAWTCLSVTYGLSTFQHLHRNKRSLTLDLKSPAGREVLLRLAGTADVLIENMRPPVKRRLGFDYDTLHARNPRRSACRGCRTTTASTRRTNGPRTAPS